MLTDEAVRGRLADVAESISPAPPPTGAVISAKRRILRLSLIAVTVVGLAAVIALSFAAFFTAGEVRTFNVPLVSDTTQVPKLVDMRVDKAEARLEDAKLVSDLRSSCDGHEAPCEVQKQSPRWGERVERGSSVVLWVVPAVARDARKAASPRPELPTIHVPSKGAVYAAGSRVLADYTCPPRAVCKGTKPPDRPIDTRVGRHTFTVVAKYGAGHPRKREISVSYRVTNRERDTRRPVIEVYAPRARTRYEPGELRASYTCGGEDIVRCVASVDDGQPTIRHGDEFALTPGSHEFTVRAVDRDGHRAVEPVHYRVRRRGADRRPEVTIAEPVDGQVYTTDDPPKAEFDCQDDSGKPKCKATLSGGDLVEPIDVRDGKTLPAQPGNYRLSVEAQDAKGHRTRKTREFKIEVAQVTLTVEIAGENQELRVTGHDLECIGGGTPCNWPFAPGTRVTLTAESQTAAETWELRPVEWENCQSTSEEPSSCTLVISEDVKVTVTPKPAPGGG
jgi:hypothetical protein